MAEEIGSGHELRPRRRAGAMSAAAWSAAVVAVAGLVLVPAVRRHLAAGDAAWLQRQWATQSALDATRKALVERAFVRTGPTDLPAYLGVVRAAEIEEADRLASIATAVHRHHHRAQDVRRAATAVERALAAQEHDLRRGDVAFSGPDTAVTFTAATARLVLAAGGLVAAAARHHGVSPPATPNVRLVAAQQRLDLLLRVTDRPVDVRLVVAGTSGTQVWDLRTGRARDLDLSNAPAALAVVPARDAVVVGGDGGYQLVPLDGSSATRLPDADRFLSAGGDGLWRVLDGRVRRYASDLTPLGSWHRFPGRLRSVLAGSSDALAVDPAGGRTMLWWPAAVRTEPLDPGCSSDVVAGRFSFGYADCDRTRLTVYDERSASRTTLHPPPGTTLDYQPITVSLDGAHVAASVLVRAASPADDTVARRRVAVFDVATGQARLVPGSDGMNAEAWSASGSVLVLADVTPRLGTVPFPLTYWQIGDPALHSIRIEGSEQLSGLTTLP